MDLLWMILLLFLVCTEAENLTEVKVELGQNIILNCSDKTISQMHWYMEIHSQLRGCIIRTFSASDTDPSYCSPSFKTKFSVQRNSLVIKNITAGDCRCYFCAKKQNDSIIYVDTFCLVSGVSTTPSPLSTQSTTCCETTHQQEPHKSTVWQDSRVMYASFTLNAFLFLLVIGLLCTFLCLKIKNRKLQVSELTLEMPQYEEIQHSTRIPQPVPVHSECIYYKAQLPRSTQS
ncbi:uncharacterized protein AKAME5_001930000 [Lates japonicus]|uniref:Immunoglobulin V-set domain-containing protein n=1 Tax=Lates japonicus TaxID=270547 RepID=A0AAD3N577_LATJO|nr:uncharacterized protein AKAME5_001930000 [Lates japonicus]